MDKLTTRYRYWKLDVQIIGTRIHLAVGFGLSIKPGETMIASGRKEGRKSLFGKVYIISCYLLCRSFSLEDHH